MQHIESGSSAVKSNLKNSSDVYRVHEPRHSLVYSHVVSWNVMQRDSFACWHCVRHSVQGISKRRTAWSPSWWLQLLFSAKQIRLCDFMFTCLEYRYILRYPRKHEVISQGWMSHLQVGHFTSVTPKPIAKMNQFISIQKAPSPDRDMSTQRKATQFIPKVTSNLA